LERYDDIDAQTAPGQLVFTEIQVNLMRVEHHVQASRADLLLRCRTSISHKQQGMFCLDSPSWDGCTDRSSRASHPSRRTAMPV
jgi:hypothetical protein